MLFYITRIIKGLGIWKLTMWNDDIGYKSKSQSWDHRSTRLKYTAGRPSSSGKLQRTTGTITRAFVL